MSGMSGCWRKGEFGLYDCREKTGGMKRFWLLLLVFFSGFITGCVCLIHVLT